MEDKLQISLQMLGGELLAGRLIINNPSAEVIECREEFSAIETVITGNKALVFVHTYMYPQNYNKKLEEFMPVIQKEIAELRECGAYKDYDIYAAGTGALQKYVSSEKEKGTFRIGGKYAAAYGVLSLISKAKAKDYGYTKENPVKLNEIPTEYAILNKLKARNGTIIKSVRIGSLEGPDGHPIDKWEIDVEEPNESYVKYRYNLFLDPYAISMEEYFRKWSGKPLQKWPLPEGFYID